MSPIFTTMARAAEVKQELIDMIERESDTSILQAIKTLLKKKGPDTTLKEKLTQRAKKSEEDISEGKVFTHEEAIERTIRSLGR